jgi:hypothetical protein
VFGWRLDPKKPQLSHTAVEVARRMPVVFPLGKHRDDFASDKVPQHVPECGVFLGEDRAAHARPFFRDTYP